MSLSLVGAGPSAPPSGAAAGWWEAGGATGAVAVYQPIGAASLAASYTDLSGNGNAAAPGTAPTWATETGWTFNGSTQFLTTGVIPTATYSLLIRFSGWSGSYVSATVKTNAFYGIRPVWVGATSFVYGDANNQLFGTTTTAGVLAIAGATAYKDGGSATGLSGTWGATAVQLFIGGGTANGTTVVAFGAGNVQAYAIYNNTLDASEIAAVTSAMQAL